MSNNHNKVSLDELQEFGNELETAVNIIQRKLLSVNKPDWKGLIKAVTRAKHALIMLDVKSKRGFVEQYGAEEDNNDNNGKDLDSITVVQRGD